MKNMNIRIEFAILVIVLILVSLAVPNPFGDKLAQASMFGSVTTPFGGTVVSVTPCTCQYTAWMAPRVVVVGPPKGGSFLQTIFTILYQNFNVSPGKNVLGIALFDMPCMQTADLACSSSGKYKYIYMIGTSK